MLLHLKENPIHDTFLSMSHTYKYHAPTLTRLSSPSEGPFVTSSLHVYLSEALITSIYFGAPWRKPTSRLLVGSPSVPGT